MHPLEHLFTKVEGDCRFAYLRADRLRKALNKSGVLDRLVKRLADKLPANVVRRMSDDDKLEAVYEAAAEKLRTQTVWAGATWQEVIVATLAQESPDLFDRVDDESNLCEPVKRWLGRQCGMSVHEQVSLGNKCADLLAVGLVGSKKRQREEFIAIELKNELKELTNNGFSQMVTYGRYAHRVYLACTPGFAIDYLVYAQKGRGSAGWSGDALDQTLREIRAGLLLVEGSRVYEVHDAPCNEPEVWNVEAVAKRIVIKNS